MVTGRPWPEDSDPVVALNLPDGYPMVTRGRVVAVGLTGGGWEYRLAFPGIADDDRARLLRLTRQRRTLSRTAVERNDLGLRRDLDVVDGWVEAMFVAVAGGRPMRAVDEVKALAGRGLEGDRYCTRRGYWTGGDACQVTLIEGEDLDCIAAAHGVSVSSGQHRRNIVTRGLDLGDLEGRCFAIGDALFEFDQPRPPCRYIASLAGPAMTRALGGRRGASASGCCGQGRSGWVSGSNSGTLHPGESARPAPRSACDDSAAKAGRSRTEGVAHRPCLHRFRLVIVRW